MFRKSSKSKLCSGPFTPTHDRYTFTCFRDAIDINRIRSHHPINVNAALVATFLLELFRREFRATFNRIGIALAKRDVARCILIKKRVVKQCPRLADRA